jgi:hypothetical protein
MECSRCHQQNREGVKFCTNCGAPLPIAPTNVEASRSRFVTSRIIKLYVAGLSIGGGVLAAVALGFWLGSSRSDVAQVTEPSTPAQSAIETVTKSPLPTATQKPVPAATLVPTPTSTLIPTLTQVPSDRHSCAEIVGTQYRSANERSWYLANCTLPRTVSVHDLAVGDCFDSQNLVGTQVGYVTLVSCSGSWQYRLISKFSAPGLGSYPGEGYLSNRANSGCPPETVVYLAPTENSWNAGDRSIQCLGER